jgi:hypothetical protein
VGWVTHYRGGVIWAVCLFLPLGSGPSLSRISIYYLFICVVCSKKIFICVLLFIYLIDDTVKMFFTGLTRVLMCMLILFF